MGGDGGYAQGPGWVPPPGVATDHGYNFKMQVRQRVGVPLGSGVNESREAPPHRIVNQEATGDRRP